MYIRKFDISSVPRDEAGAAQWLSQLYVEKDELLDNFHKTGKFDDKFSGVSLPARPNTLIISATLNLLNLCCLLKLVLISGQSSQASVPLNCITSFYPMTRSLGLTSRYRRHCPV